MLPLAPTTTRIKTPIARSTRRETPTRSVRTFTATPRGTTTRQQGWAGTAAERSGLLLSRGGSVESPELEGAGLTPGATARARAHRDPLSLRPRRDGAVDDQVGDETISRQQPLAYGAEDALDRLDASRQLFGARRPSFCVLIAVDEECALQAGRQFFDKRSEGDGSVVVVLRDDLFGRAAVREIADLQYDAVAAYLGIGTDLDS
jgi:hypothetical protein